jgi:hypothetical protein
MVKNERQIRPAPSAEAIILKYRPFLTTSEERTLIRHAVAVNSDDWQAHRRFTEVNGYEGERLPAPPLTLRPKAPQ